jgi:hypothetical protein
MTNKNHKISEEISGSINFGKVFSVDHSSSSESSHGDAEHGESEGHGESVETLFGSLGRFKPKIVAAALAIIVGTVLAMEYLFHGLHELTHDTPFHKMVSTIEKELMIVGCTAFLFKIFVNTTTFLEHNWLFALEYSGLLTISQFGLEHQFVHCEFNRFDCSSVFVF